MPRRIDHLIIGGGVAAATCAQTLREEGAQGTILVASREPEPPYHRPPISKDYLGGARSRDLVKFHPDEWWETSRIELATRTSVTALDTAARTATLSGGEEINFERALLATGAMVRRLNVDGAELDGIHYLRVLGNADALRADVEHAERVVVIGGSYMGCEVAATLTGMGKRCTIVMQEAVTLERAFGAQAGAFFQSILEQHGIELIASDEVRKLEGDSPTADDEPGRVRRVLTQSGRALEADVVVAGVGAIPDVALARRAGLELGSLGGVLCDARLETSTPGIWAAGDMCEYDSQIHGRVMRVEHEEVAISQGHTAALNMLGADRPHVAVPYFFSDFSDWVSLEYVGPAEGWDEEVLSGSFEEGEFALFYRREGRTVGCLSVGRSDDLEHARRLISGEPEEIPGD